MMTPERLCSLASHLVKEAEDYRDSMASWRRKANDYYDGNTDSDIPPMPNRSKVVSRDVRSALGKIKPSIIRTILGNEKVVEYQPIGEGDEEMAEQATDYINLFVFPESGGREAVEDAIDDALKLRNGVLKWYQDVRTTVTVSMHTGLDDGALTALVQDDSVEPLEHSAREEQVDTPNGPQMVAVHDIRIKRVEKKSIPRMESVPLENLLIHPDAISERDSLLVGENKRIRRSDLVAMGYDRAIVDDLNSAGSNDDQDDERASRQRDRVLDGEGDLDRAMQDVEYYELLVRVDYDDDGIAELRRLVFAGGLTEENLLENEYWDEVNYVTLVSKRRPHQWEGESVSDDAMEIQKIKTVLLRGTLDNLYWQNNLQPIVDTDAVENPESVLQPDFGEPIRIKSGRSVSEAITYSVVPFVAQQSFGMLAYLDDELTDRTGISDASSGLAPDALQNMTATGANLIEQGGIAQAEMMARTIAAGLKTAFAGLLKLVVQHQDKPRTVRMRDKWVTYDPRTWDAGMDVTVNTGLGAGTRERDMMMMGQVIGLQEKLLASFGAADNPFVSPDNLYNGISKIVESSGLKGVDQYFTKPDPQAIQQKQQEAAQQPSEAEQKAQAQVQVEQAKLQGQMQLAQAKMQADASKEVAQRDADLQVKMAEIEKNRQQAADQIAAQQARDADQIAWEREKLIRTQEFEREKLERTAAIEATRAISAMGYDVNQERELELLDLSMKSQPANGEGAQPDRTTEILAQLTQMAGQMGTALTAPTELIRDENGRAIGARKVIQNDAL